MTGFGPQDGDMTSPTVPKPTRVPVNGVELEATTNDPEGWEGLRRYYVP